MTPEQVRERLDVASDESLLAEFESSVWHISGTEALYRGGPIAKHDFIGYDVFRRELPLVRAEILARLRTMP